MCKDEEERARLRCQLYVVPPSRNEKLHMVGMKTLQNVRWGRKQKIVGSKHINQPTNVTSRPDITNLNNKIEK